MISVVIPTYNEEKNIKKCLKQFDNQTLNRDKFELIVVDGNSTDKTREIAEKVYINGLKICTGYDTELSELAAKLNDLNIINLMKDNLKDMDRVATELVK